MKKALLIIGVVFWGFVMGGCKQDQGPIEDDSDNGNVSYDQVQAIFDQYCISCHPSSGNLDLRRGQSYNQLVNVPASGYQGLRVSPGHSDQSVLFGKIDGSGRYGSNMPLGGSLSQQQIDLIKDWIDQGARNQ